MVLLLHELIDGQTILLIASSILLASPAVSAVGDICIWYPYETTIEFDVAIPKVPVVLLSHMSGVDEAKLDLSEGAFDLRIDGF